MTTNPPAAPKPKWFEKKTPKLSLKRHIGTDGHKATEHRQNEHQPSPGPEALTAEQPPQPVSTREQPADEFLDLQQHSQQDLQQQLLEENHDLQQQLDHMQRQIDSLLSLTNQVDDAVIEKQFKELFEERIVTWSMKLTSSNAPGGREPPEEWRKFCCRVCPYAEETTKFNKLKSEKRNLENLARGLVACVLCEYIFSPKGQDYWLDTEARSWFRGIEARVRPSYKEPSGDAHRTFNDWRATTAYLLSHAGYDETGKLLNSNDLQSLAHQVYETLDAEHSGSESDAGLESILDKAVELSKLIRQQRPEWLILFPELAHSSDNINSTLQSVQSLDYDPLIMWDTEYGDGYGKPPAYVNFCFTPILYKRGTLGGDQFDENHVVRKASVAVAAEAKAAFS